MKNADLDYFLRGVGPGWHSLVREAWSLCLERTVEIFKVKERSGRLMIMVDLSTQDIGREIEAIEKRSTHICEECGKPGKVYKIKGKLMARCQACATEEEYYE